MARDYLSLVIDDVSGDDVYEIRHSSTCDMIAEIDAKKMFKEQQRYMPRLRKIKNWHVETVAL